MPQLRISEAATLLGVSDDTVRRWAEQGKLPLLRSSGRLTVDGRVLADFIRDSATGAGTDSPTGRASARNQLRGIVTRVLADTVMAQVEMQCGPFRVVSLMTREAVEELGLDVGVVAVASVKATHVVVGLPEPR